jgi:uncharacterized membrane protein YgcG
MPRAVQHASRTIQPVESEISTKASPIKRLTATVHQGQAGSRSPVLDGPWWVGLMIAVALAALVFGSAPWKWIAVPIVVVLLWLPFCVRWALALGRAVGAFREGFRS